LVQTRFPKAGRCSVIELVGHVGMGNEYPHLAAPTAHDGHKLIKKIKYLLYYLSQLGFKA